MNADKGPEIMSDIIYKEKGNILWILRIAPDGDPGYNKGKEPKRRGKQERVIPFDYQKGKGHGTHTH